jgi:hypothetical protein
VLRPRGRAPDTPRNRARQREEDATIALLRQQQEIMAQMVEQQQRTSAVTELRRGPFKYQRSKVVSPRHLRLRSDRRHQPHQNIMYLSHRLILSWHHVLPNEHQTRRPSQKPRIGVASHLQWPPAQRKLQDDVQLLQVWTRRTQPNSWRSVSGTPRTPKYPLRRSCRRQSDVSAKQRLDGRSSTRVSGNALQNFAPNFLATYWSAGQQLAVRARVLSQRYNLTKVDSTVDFFMEQATQLRTLTQPIWECVMVEDLMRLFPENISLLFKSEKPRGERSIQGALDFLERQSCYSRQNANERSFASRKTDRGGTTSNRTDTTSATTKDGFVCRRRRNEEAEPFSMCQPQQVTNRETTTGRGREVFPSIEGQPNLHVPQDQICHGKIWRR